MKSVDEFGKRIAKPVLQEAVDYWHSNFMPKHFEPGAPQRYGYRGRTPKYLKAKYRAALRGKPQARNPLTFSGKMREMVTQMITISGTNKKAVGTMKGPQYLYMYSLSGLGGVSTRPNMGLELTTVTREESDKIAAFIKKRMTDAMNSQPDRSELIAG